MLGAFPLSWWLIMIVPPVLMIGVVSLWYAREVKIEKAEDKLFGKK